MRAVACALLFGCVAVPGAATTLYRCVSADGSVSYQDVGCVDDQVETRRFEVEPEARSGKRTSKAKTTKAAARGKPTARSATASGSDSRSRARAACTQARLDRDAVLERVELGRTFEDLRKLDDGVRKTCKGL